ncbi:MAG TPA: ATP-binding protein [Kofleriaceae bacterium]|jgi:predicted AAA+ superfamily ATPase|nr:ATP-binding protein [Kofleriaceae bacterium]
MPRADLKRSAAARLDEHLETFRVTAVTGARQIGKSTLVASLPGRTYVTLDDVGVLASASRDPVGFIAGLPPPVTIDEIQRVPELLLAIKQRVDRDRTRGQYVLTGSSRLDTLRGIRESLAGRTATLELGPLTWPERRGTPDASPVDTLFDLATVKEAVAAYAAIRDVRRVEGRDVLDGGFPEPVLELPARARTAWFREYIKTYIERDVPAIVHVADVPAFIRFVTACATTSASLLNTSELARDLGIAVDTVRRWIGVLETTFVAHRLTPFARNIRTRLVKSPKLFLADTGLMAALLGITDWHDAVRRNLTGPLVETWFHQQLHALCALATDPVELSFFRTHGQVEVDFVLERAGRLVPLEIKAGATVRPGDARGIEAFIEHFPRAATFGLVLHMGEALHPVTQHAAAVPLGTFLSAG